MSMGPPESLRVGTTGAACNLAAALLNLLNPSGALAKNTQDLLRWLERSGIDEASFDNCIKAAWGLAYPNGNGMVLFDGVAQADLRLQKLTKATIAPIADLFQGARPTHRQRARSKLRGFDNCLSSYPP